jgi:predicted metal-dependent hydrolase
MKIVFKRSSRAKRIIIKVNERKEIIIVIPPHTKRQLAYDFYVSKKEWIKKQLDKFPDREKDKKIPNKLNLLAINSEYKVYYHRCDNKVTINVSIKDRQIDIFCNVKDKKSCIFALKKALKIIAKKHFAVIIEEIAKKHKFSYNRLFIKDNKSNWGSCSHLKNINLTIKLLFLPYELLEFIMVHELAHTKHPNHSKDFYDLCAKKLSNNATLGKKFKQTAHKYIPMWMNY